jgi:hypothetical protein
MAQRFLLSAASRTLKIKEILRMGEDKAYEKFCKIRWAETQGEPVCPRCGCLNAYRITTRRKFKCAGCYHQYSVTAGTPLCVSQAVIHGHSGGDLHCRERCQGSVRPAAFPRPRRPAEAAFVLAHKMREAMATDRPQTPLEGEVEVDGMYNGCHVRPNNFKADRVDRRLARNQTGKRRFVVAFRQRKGRTLTFVCNQESEGAELAKRFVSRSAIKHADEASHWDALHAGWQVGRLAGSITRKPTALKMSAPIRLKASLPAFARMIRGQHHHVSARYLSQYANHAAWLEDHRRMSNGDLTRRIVALGLAAPVSRQWKGYWQRRFTAGY